MIKSIEIKNFKLYKENTKIPLSNINLLTGINGKGKSSLLQIFLLLSQSALKNRTTNKIILNGNNVKLGSIDDVKNRDTSFSESIDFKFYYDNFDILYKLSHTQSDSSELNIDKIAVKGFIDNQYFEFVLDSIDDDYYGVTKINTKHGDHNDFATTLFDLFIDSNSFLKPYDDFNWDCQYVKENLNLNYIHYVSADRSGPKNYYENKTLGHFVSVGAFGEDTVNVLHHKGTESINMDLFQMYCNLFGNNPEETSRTVEDHTTFWMDKIFQGAKVKVEPIKGEDLLKLRISADNSSPYFKPTNVGYGFSYSLPIIVAGLVAKPGEILIVENPEAHLHPYAQSILAKFLAIVSITGVQVLIESHSEHILNGLRIAVYDELITNEDLNVLYFGGSEENYFSKIAVNEDGGIKDWPPNFFDQATKDLNYLFGI